MFRIWTFMASFWTSRMAPIDSGGTHMTSAAAMVSDILDSPRNARPLYGATVTASMRGQATESSECHSPVVDCHSKVSGSIGFSDA